jgi:2-polyprenyl-3-methyl-5-hydroxy-6-metoxy-1,4-benzoquinol methylase
MHLNNKITSCRGQGSHDRSGMSGGNLYNKYASRNPIERYLVNCFIRQLHALTDKTKASSIHEVGCGEGVLIASLARVGRVLFGTDCSKEIIREAAVRHADLQPPITFETVPIEDLKERRHAAQLVVCCEVLEHVSEPDRVLAHLGEIARPHVIISVPREPLWRCLNMLRLKYVAHLGNTPGHINHWSTSAFLNLVSKHFEILDVRQPLPWTMALCRVKMLND